MKRSQHTNYKRWDANIYEYKKQYFILQMCQQGQELNPDHGPGQLASDFCALGEKIPVESSSVVIGHAVLSVLNDFDIIGHSYGKFDIPARNKLISSWFGARGMGSLEKNVRVVQVIKYLGTGVIDAIPFDNYNKNNFNGPMEEGVIRLNTEKAEDVGEAVKAAFRLATFHPERKDPK